MKHLHLQEEKNPNSMHVESTSAQIRPQCYTQLSCVDFLHRLDIQSQVSRESSGPCHQSLSPSAYLSLPVSPQQSHPNTGLPPPLGLHTDPLLHSSGASLPPQPALRQEAEASLGFSITQAPANQTAPAPLLTHLIRLSTCGKRTAVNGEAPPGESATL